MTKHAFRTIELENAPIELRKLYNNSALTFEGMTVDEGNLAAIYKALEDCGAAPNSAFEFVIIKGHTMNAHYHLTGSNAYPDGLNILCCPLGGFDNYSALVFWRFTCGGRWFDDVVDNNARREDEASGIAEADECF